MIDATGASSHDRAPRGRDADTSAPTQGGASSGEEFPCEVSQAFRQAMRRLTAAVTLVTATSDRRRHGMAATAVCSLTADPPALLACVNRSASLHQPIVDSGRYCVNILSYNHHPLVPLFSGKLSGEDRFEFGDWADHDGVPYLVDSQASIFCSVATSVQHGTHTIFIGTVDHVRLAGETGPLLFQDGAFCRAADLMPIP